MVRFILRLFAGLFGSVSAAAAIALVVDQERGGAVMGGLFAFFPCDMRSVQAGGRNPVDLDARLAVHHRAISIF